MAKESHFIVCIRCPKGCHVTAEVEDGQVSEIDGASCKLGSDYVKAEILHPTRVLTTTVRVKDGTKPLVPVWTVEPIPKEKIFDLVRELRNIELEAPVKTGDKVLTDVFGSGVDVETSGNVKRDPHV